MAEEVARRLDQTYGTRGAFVELYRHAGRCVAENGGLDGTGVFFVLLDGVIRPQVYRVGVDEPMLERLLAAFGATDGFKGHGTIVGALVGGLDSVLLQFCAVDSGHISIRWDVATHKDEVDDANFRW